MIKLSDPSKQLRLRVMITVARQENKSILTPKSTIGFFLARINQVSESSSAICSMVSMRCLLLIGFVR